MYEPKYKLNQRDSKRWHELLVRHCLETPGTKPQKKYPPLTKAENIEFERLCRKRSRKICSHPKVKASIRRSYRQMRKLDQAAAKLKRLIRKMQLKNNVDRKR